MQSKSFLFWGELSGYEATILLRIRFLKNKEHMQSAHQAGESSCTHKEQETDLDHTTYTTLNTTEQLFEQKPGTWDFLELSPGGTSNF